MQLYYLDVVCGRGEFIWMLRLFWFSIPLCRSHNQIFHNSTIRIDLESGNLSKFIPVRSRQYFKHSISGEWAKMGLTFAVEKGRHVKFVYLSIG